MNTEIQDHETRNLILLCSVVAITTIVVMLTIVYYLENGDYPKIVKDISAAKSCFKLNDIKENEINWKVSWNNHYDNLMNLMDNKAEELKC